MTPQLAKPMSPDDRPTRLRCRRLALVFTGALLALLAFSVATADATKTHLFLERFGSANQLSLKEGDHGLAVDQSTGDLLVIDSVAKTVSRYNPDGTPADFTALGSNVIDAKGAGNCPSVPADCDQTPENGFEFSPGAGEQQLAVDNSGTITDGNIYVTQGQQSAGNLVDIFASDGKYLGQITAANGVGFGTIGSFPFSPCGVAVDPDGNVYLGGGYDQNKLYKFAPSTNPPTGADLVATSAGSAPICSLAAGAGPSAGSLFANTFVTGKGNSTLKFSSGLGGPKYVVDPGENLVLSVDPSTGHLYALGGTLNASTNLANFKVTEYDVSGSAPVQVSTTKDRIEFGPNPKGIAVDGVSGKLYVSNAFQINVYGPLVTVPDVTTGSAVITGDTSVKLAGTVDGDGVALEECRFEYGTTTAYGQEIPCAETPAEIGTGLKGVHVDLSGLAAETLYHYRLVARNSNSTITGSDNTFKTPTKPEIAAQYASSVSTDAAVLKAAINPGNSNTTYRVEWGSDSSYGHSTAEVALGSDAVEHTASTALGELAPGATYHYRFVATNTIGVTTGSDRTFTTFPPPLGLREDCSNQAFRSGHAASLPDCRAYEMVSPLDKENGDILSLVSLFGPPAALDRSSASGDRFTYSSFRSFAGSPSAPFTSQYLATRDPQSGWSNQGISLPSSPSHLEFSFVLDTEFRIFSEDLCQAWVFHPSMTPLTADAVPGYSNLYQRDNCDGGTLQALSTVKPPHTGPRSYRVEPQGTSADGHCAVFRANDSLTAEAPYVGFGHADLVLYESCVGQLRLVSVLPNGNPYQGAVSAGTGGAGAFGSYRYDNVYHAVSDDGSRVYWTAAGGGLGSLYVRANAEQPQSKVSGGKCTEGAKACTFAVAASAPGVLSQFLLATPSGSKAIYSVFDSSGRNLFEYDFQTKKSIAIAGDVVGAPLGASEDLSRLYLVSKEALAPGALAGQPNLYLEEGGAFTLIAKLSENDITNEAAGGANVFSPGSLVPVFHAATVSADGLHLAFNSSAPLSGYDNADAVSGEADTEVYHYDAAPGESGQLHCVSCNPTGARPAGREAGYADGGANPYWFAARLSGWANDFYDPHSLSEDGSRLFFESADALVPRDTNGVLDVYGWLRADSEGACEEAGAELYVQSAGGCLSLISSGTSTRPSAFIDASPSGRDVFFTTASSLLPQDSGLVDVYDARAGGGFPAPQPPPAACEGEACQGPIAAPDDPTPASSAFEGAGNLEAQPAARPRCKKGNPRRHGRCAGRHRHHGQANRNRRTPR